MLGFGAECISFFGGRPTAGSKGQITAKRASFAEDPSNYHT